MSLQVSQVRDDLLSKLGIDDASTAPEQALQDVVVAINAAMQQLQSAGQDFFTRQTLTVALSAGTAIYTIPSTAQAILGPVRWNDEVPLRALESQGEYDQFARIFDGSASYGGGSDGDPMAYFVKYLRQGSTGNVCSISIWLAPAPSTPPGNIVAEVVNGAPAYTTADLDGSTDLPVAQDYTESVFLPLARMFITRSSQFSRPDLLPLFVEDYQRAMTLLSTVGGFPNAQQPTPFPRETEG